MADTLIATLYMEYGYNDIRPSLEIYRSENGRIFGIEIDSDGNGKKIYGNPTIVVRELREQQQKYNAPSMMYTGVSSGGFSTGQATYYPGTVSNKRVLSGKGIIFISIGDSSHDGDLIKPSPEMVQAFKRDPVYQTAYKGERYNESGIFLKKQHYQFYSGFEDCFPIEYLNKLAGLLKRMLNYELPKSDQELYEEASRLATSNDPSIVARAVTTFESISDYKDADEQALKAKTRQSILLYQKSEKRKKKIKIGVIIGIIVLCVIFIFIFKCR